MAKPTIGDLIPLGVDGELESAVSSNTAARHTHSNKTILDKLSVSDGKLQYDEEDISSGKQDKLTAGDNITITNNTISATDTKYTHPTHTAKANGLYKVTVDNQGHVSATGAIAKADIVALGIPAQDTKVVTSATEPDLSTGDQWHKEI